MSSALSRSIQTKKPANERSFLKPYLSPCIILLQALRPHGERVTAVKQSPDLSLIATGSSDKTIFIFNKQQKGLSPIGFVQATGSVIDFIWRDDKTILAWCSNHTGRAIHNNKMQPCPIPPRDFNMTLL